MTVYRSKVDVWLVALSVGIMAAACVPGLLGCADGVPAVAGSGCVGCVQHPL